jgi:hypothetical protein
VGVLVYREQNDADHALRLLIIFFTRETKYSVETQCILNVCLFIYFIYSNKDGEINIIETANDLSYDNSYMIYIIRNPIL